MPPSRFDRRLDFPPDTAREITKLLARIDECKGYWQAFQRLSPEYLERMKRAVIISSSGASTRIEGARLRDDQVEQLLRDASVRPLATRDEQEVMGYIETIKEVFESWRAMPLSENLIKQIHAMTLQFSEKDARHKGHYKFGPNRVQAVDAKGAVVGIIFDPTPPHLTAKEMHELVEWTRQQLAAHTYHPLLVIAHFIFEYLAIHPFQDGNGRTSRILTNLLLLQQGYGFVPYVSHEKLIEDHKVEYYLALKRTTATWKKQTEDLSPWMLFILRMFADHGEMAVALTNEDLTEQLLSAKQLAVWRALQEGRPMSRKDIADVSGVNIRTVEQALKKLVALKKIMQIGRARATRYRIVGSQRL